VRSLGIVIFVLERRLIGDFHIFGEYFNMMRKSPISWIRINNVTGE